MRLIEKPSREIRVVFCRGEGGVRPGSTAIIGAPHRYPIRNHGKRCGRGKYNATRIYSPGCHIEAVRVRRQKGISGERITWRQR